MEGGDLKTLSRGSRQSGGIFGLAKLLGFGDGKERKRPAGQMADPLKEQMLMQRGGIGPLAGLAGLSLLPMLMGRGREEDVIRSQMQTTRDPIMQRGGVALPPLNLLLAKGGPMLKHIGVPLALGALASVSDNVVDKIFGAGPKARSGKPRINRKPRSGKLRSGKRQSRALKKSSRKPSRATALQINSKEWLRGKRNEHCGMLEIVRGEDCLKRLLSDRVH